MQYRLIQRLLIICVICDILHFKKYCCFSFQIRNQIWKLRWPVYKIDVFPYSITQSFVNDRTVRMILNHPIYSRSPVNNAKRSSYRKKYIGTTSIHAKSKDDFTVGSNIDDTDSDNISSIETTSISIQQRKKQLSYEFIRIGGPALIQLAAEPLASLVDTAYLGRLGPAVLGGAGVAISAHYAVSKLYNDPLLRTSISLVASASGSGMVSTGTSISKDITTSNITSNNVNIDNNTRQNDLSIAVSSALLLAAVVGIVQLVIYTVFCRTITMGMGLSPLKDGGTNGMWNSAVSYLRIRALGTPAATLWLVTNGIFRGLGDTKTPLLYAFVFTSLNAILDPLFMFGPIKMGAAGAAAGTAIAQYVALVPLILALHRKVGINVFGQVRELKQSIRQYLNAGSLVLIRSFGKVFAYAVCARQAALLGSVAAAAYNLTFQLGFATTQICEAVAVAVQTLIAKELSVKIAQTVPNGNEMKMKPFIIRHLIDTSIWIGGGVATILSLVTFWRRDMILNGLTTNVAIQTASASIFPIVLITQVLKGLAYPVNGIIMGGLDWVYSMIAMWIANFVCVGMVYNFASRNVNGVASLGQLWWSLAAFMGVQVVAGILRYESKTGVWKVMRQNNTQD